MEATVAERGQITLPKAVRDALGLTKGTQLKVELDGGRIILRKNVDDAISRARGRFKLDGFASTARGDQPSSIGGEGDADRRIQVAVDGFDQLAFGGIEQPDLPRIVGRSHQSGIG